MLLDAGALVEEPNENGHTPLMEAASGGHISEGVGQARQEVFSHESDLCWYVWCELSKALQCQCSYGKGYWAGLVEGQPSEIRYAQILCNCNT